MKTTRSRVLAFLWLIETASFVVAQTSAIPHNTWTNGAPMQIAVWDAAVAVLDTEIYVVGGNNANNQIVANTQIYKPSTDTWSTGVPLPTTLTGAVGAVVNNVLYVMGGSVDGLTYSNAVWAFNPRTKVWSSKAAMPTALSDTGVAVENGLIYVISGNSADNLRATTVESYDPATDTWTYEAPLLVGRSEPSVVRLGGKLVGFTIVVADGYASGGDTESYNATDNQWTTLAADPVPVPDGWGWRSFACSGGIGSKLYVAGGYYGPPVFLSSLNESFDLHKNAWTTLAPMPQAVMGTNSAVYRGRLYCIGGTLAYWSPGALNNVQIYQP